MSKQFYEVVTETIESHHNHGSDCGYWSNHYNTEKYSSYKDALSAYKGKIDDDNYYECVMLFKSDGTNEGSKMLKSWES